MNKIYLILLGIFFISFASALTCSDSFSSSNHVLFCGYCYEQNGSTCIASRTCNVTISYPNGTYFVQDHNTTNNGDGTFTYNISQGTLADGTYLGILDCGNRSYDDFSFTISTTIQNVGGGGASYPTFYEIDQIIKNITTPEKNRIPNDFKKYQYTLINKFFPNSRGYGLVLFWIVILFILFYKEIFKLKKKIKSK